jgi:hypothetical protein
MRFVQVDRDQWVENCTLCHVAMKPIDSGGQTFLGVVESFPQGVLLSERAQLNFQNWECNPIIQPPYWFCESCKTVWGVVFGWWTKTQFKGEIEALPATYMSASGVERLVDYTPPFKGASMCPHCHTWRHIVDTVVQGIGDDQEITNTHFCIECKSTQDIITPSKKKQRDNFVTENMTLEGLVGDRSPVKLSQQ